MIIKSEGRVDSPSKWMVVSSPASSISVVRGISIKPSARAKPVIEPEPFPVEYALNPSSLRTRWTRLNSVRPLSEFNRSGTFA